jgi:hypothetical protein
MIYLVSSETLLIEVRQDKIDHATRSQDVCEAPRDNVVRYKWMFHDTM